MSEASSLRETTDISERYPHNAVAQDANYNGALPLLPFNVGLVEGQGTHCSTGSLIQQIPRFPCFGSGSFLEGVSSFALSEDASYTNPHDPMENKQGVGDLNGGKINSLKDFDCFDSPSSSNKIQKFQSAQQQKYTPTETVKGPGVKDRGRQIPCADTRKSALKQVKKHLQNGDGSKEEYNHVRAKRGKATSNHSLAERVRREKISERMRLLQDLVPGCYKITGKAVMLDEIINYVQSLQRQVEFLSMKLATVDNPELNFEIEQILSKDVLHSRATSTAALMFDRRLSTSNPHFHGFISQAVMQPEMASLNYPNCQELLKGTFSHVPRTSCYWDNEVQNVLQMGFIPNSIEPPASMGLE